MGIYYTIMGGHVHCRVFCMNGDLVFSETEWEHRFEYFGIAARFIEEK